MRYGLLSGMLWGLDTVILSIALMMSPYGAGTEPVLLAAIAGAFFHDACCAIWLFGYMGIRRRLRDTLMALRSPSGRFVIAGALLGGPVGMTGYVIAISNIGAAFTAIISAFYPAVGTLLAYVLLKERMSRSRIAALLVALLAVMTMGYLSAGKSEIVNAPWGLAGAALCVLGWGSEAVLGAKGMGDEAVDVETALQIRETASALVYGIVILPLFGARTFAAEAAISPAGGVIALAALAGTASYLCYYKGISAIGAARAMALNISYSAWAVLFSLLLLQIVPTIASTLCCILIIGGTVLAASSWRELVEKNRIKRGG